MKRITLLIAILLNYQLGFAQEEVAIEQRIEQPINRLEIYRGWDVHLLHNEADSGYRVAIVTNEDYAPFAFNVQLCNVKGDTLTILKNTHSITSFPIRIADLASRSGNAQNSLWIGFPAREMLL